MRIINWAAHRPGAKALRGRAREFASTLALDDKHSSSGPGVVWALTDLQLGKTEQALGGAPRNIPIAAKFDPEGLYWLGAAFKKLRADPGGQGRLPASDQKQPERLRRIAGDIRRRGAAKPRPSCERPSRELKREQAPLSGLLDSYTN